MMRRLFHFSEDPNITVFEPRTPDHRPGIEPLVWTVDNERAWTYLFPRDCPRILLWPTETTSPEDHQRWFGNRSGARVACIEWAWLERMHSTPVFRYDMDPTNFVPLQDDPWMWVSRQTERPLQVEPVGDLVEALGREEVELRVMPSLAPLFGAWESTIHFSGIRLRNATGWPEVAPSPPPRTAGGTPPA